VRRTVRIFGALALGGAERMRVVACVVGFVLGQAAHPALIGAHDTPVAPLVVGSTAEGGGALRLIRTANDPIEVTPSATAGGFVLYTAADPSFESPEGGEGVFPLLDGTQVTVQLVAVGETSGVKLRGQSLLAAGDSVVLGTMPSLHAHPEWQLTLPEGESGCQTIRLRVTAAGSAYADSDEYVLQIADDPAACVAEPRCGDADGNGAVSVTDGVVVLRTAAGLGTACADVAPCDIDGNGAVSVTDGVNVLRAAAGLVLELTCPDL
jgi:hypothetical protein